MALAREDLPPESARAAGLRYVSDRMPGIARARTKDSFEYALPDGHIIEDEEILARIRSLAIPPAYENVWISPIANGHLQATGRDARGRKQYRYHPRWREVRDEAKFERIFEFARALPRIRQRVEADLRRHGLPREKVLATVVRLLELTLVRVGNDEYARANRSFGLTTLRVHHVTVDGARMRFRFRGKSGVVRDVGVRDRRLASIVRRLADLPGQDLFEYVDDDGSAHSVGSADVNQYLREVSGGDFSAKDFRTLAGTVRCAGLLASLPACDTPKEARDNAVAAVKSVAQLLGNTPAVCRKAYIHPALIEDYIARRSLAFSANGARGNGDYDALYEDERAAVRAIERLVRRAKKRTPT